MENKKLYGPFVRSTDRTDKVMTDVIIALMPAIIMAGVAYGFAPIAVILVSIAGAVVGEYLFSAIFRRDTKSIADGSAIVTGILLAFTIGAFTPLYITALGAAAATVFGKMMWGGVGRNRFNPALIGREFMVVFFPAVMNYGDIWSDRSALQHASLNITGNQMLNDMIFEPIGAIGEYSPIFLALGGLYLLLRRRISWHIPAAMLITFGLLLLVFREQGLQFTVGGLMLGAIYMATDMPTSSSTPAGKVYSGIILGAIAISCLLFGISKGYASYSILIANAFVVPINWVFRTRVWGRKTETGKLLWQGALLTAAIAATTAVVILIHKADAIQYLVYAYILYTIVRFAATRDGIPWARLRSAKAV